MGQRVPIDKNMMNKWTTQEQTFIIKQKYGTQVKRLAVAFMISFMDMHLCGMWAYLRTRTSNRSGRSRSTSFSLGSTLTRLSLGPRLTISTLRLEGKRGNSSRQLALLCPALKISIKKKNTPDSYRRSSKSSSSRTSSFSTLSLL